MSRFRNWCGSHRGCLMAAVGFLAGTVGVKALTSDAAKKGYVKIVAEGMKAKNAYLDVCEQAKAAVDDVVAEASYMAGDAAGQEAPAEAKA